MFNEKLKSLDKLILDELNKEGISIRYGNENNGYTYQKYE